MEDVPRAAVRKSLAGPASSRSRSQGSKKYSQLLHDDDDDITEDLSDSEDPHYAKLPIIN